jgi:hypothetical protein
MIAIKQDPLLCIHFAIISYFMMSSTCDVFHMLTDMTSKDHVPRTTRLLDSSMLIHVWSHMTFLQDISQTVLWSYL